MQEPNERYLHISQLIAYTHSYWAGYPKMRYGQILAIVANHQGVDVYDMTDMQFRLGLEAIWMDQISGGVD